MAAEHYGDTIRIERERQLLSQKRLATMAGVSRRHLASAERGANISIDVLRKLARALGMTQIDVGEGLAVTVPGGKTLAAVIAPFADGIEQNARASLQLARELRGVTKPWVGKSAPSDTPEAGHVSAEAQHLVELVSEFARNVQTLTDPDQVRSLERRVSDLLDRSTA
jgi:transcriptional regulator with XRE-family HTH domain